MMNACTIKQTAARLLLAALAATMATGSVKAQNYLDDHISLTVNPVMPPYTGRLSDYFGTPGKIGGSILVKSHNLDASSFLFYLHASIVNSETEASVRTKTEFVPSNPREVDLSVIPNTTLIRYDDLQQAMSEQNLEYSGFTREQVAREGLPPGQYMICLRLFVKTEWMNRFEQLRTACSPPFTIMPIAVEPPIIINPVNNSRLNPEQKQSLQFNWTMPGGAPAGTQYKLKIIEVNDKSGNFRDMLHNDRYPAFFETTVSATPMYLYTAANPPFKEEKTYAFVVKAFTGPAMMDNMTHGRVTFKNNGYSEINTFSFKDGAPVMAQKTPKDTPPVVAEERLKIFIPTCADCESDPNAYYANNLTSGTTYQLLGNTLNPNTIASDPTNTRAMLNPAPVSIHIPANAVAVNNAKNFYLRWEDKSSLLETLNPEPGEGIIYHIQIRDAANKKPVWEKKVWNSSSYEQTKHGLPFVDKKEYILHIAAVKGVVAQRGFDMVTDKKGNPIAIASSCDCKFTFMELPDVPDLVEYTVKGKLSYKFEHHPEKYPITTRTATLTRYTSFYDVTNKRMVSDHIETPRDDRHSIPITINNDGTFETTVYAHPNNGLITASLKNGTQFETREFFNIELNSPYYRLLEKSGKKSAKTRVNLTDKVIDVGEITFNVWSYTLEIEVTKGYSRWVSGELTGSYRDNNPQHVTGKASRIMFGLEGFEDMPYYEGDIPATTPISKWGKGDIAAGKVENKKDAKGVMRTYVTFDKLICNYQSNDCYYINVNQTLEENGKKEEYFTNEFSHNKFQYRPDNKEVRKALNSYKSNFLVKRKATLIDRTPPKSTVKGKLVFADPSVDRNKTQPLPNTDIALVVTYLVEGKNGKQTVMDIPHIRKEESENPGLEFGKDNYKYDELYRAVLGKFEDRNLILATSKTNANGEFEFTDFPQIDSTYVKEIDETVKIGGAAVTSLHMQGKLIRTVRLVVNSPKKHRWLNPSVNIDVQPNTTTDVKTLTAYLDTYILSVRPIGDPDDNRIERQNQILKNASVKIIKERSYAGESKSLLIRDSMTVRTDDGCDFSIPKHMMNNNADVSIYNSGGGSRQIIHNNMPNDIKIVVTTSDSVGEHAFKPDKASFPKYFYQREQERMQQKGNFSDVPICKEIFNASYNGEYRYTNDYKKTVCQINVIMYPKNPIISGHVLDAENTQRSVEQGEVMLRENTDCFHELTEVFHQGSKGSSLRSLKISEANRNGFFSFKNLVPNYEVMLDKQDNEGFDRYHYDSDYQLFVKARGYTLSLFQQEGKEKKENIKFNIWFPAEPMKPKMGQQIHFPMILMRPNGWITGCVVDEEDNPMRATVRTTRSRLVSTEQAPPGAECFTKKNILFGSKKARFSTVTAPCWFKVYAPSGYTDTLFVSPDDQNFFPDTLLIPAMPEGEYQTGKVVMKERLHRIRISVIPAVNNLSVRPPGIPGVTVKLYIPGNKNEVITDQWGVAEFVFKNTSTSFHYEIIPPDNSDYIAAAGELTNEASKEMITYSVMLPKGATVSGTVTTEGKPVPNAQIWVMNGIHKRETTTDSNGKYTLRGIKTMETAAKK